MLNGLRGAMTRLFTPAARMLLRAGVSPDAVTVTGTVVVVVTALWAFPTGHLLVGALVVAATALADSLDGVMARQAGRSGPWGAFLDSTLDRFADAAVFSGLLLWFVGHDDRVGHAGLLLALACLVLGSIVPYARARAEGVGMTAAVGIAERADRLFVVLAGTAVVGLGAPRMVLVLVLGLLAVASAVTVGQRVATVHAQARAGTS